MRGRAAPLLALASASIRPGASFDRLVFVGAGPYDDRLDEYPLPTYEHDSLKYRDCFKSCLEDSQCTAFRFAQEGFGPDVDICQPDQAGTWFHGSREGSYEAFSNVEELGKCSLWMSQQLCAPQKCHSASIMPKPEHRGLLGPGWSVRGGLGESPKLPLADPVEWTHWKPNGLVFMKFSGLADYQECGGVLPFASTAVHQGPAGHGWGVWQRAPPKQAWEALPGNAGGVQFWCSWKDQHWEEKNAFIKDGNVFCKPGYRLQLCFTSFSNRFKFYCSPCSTVESTGAATSTGTPGNVATSSPSSANLVLSAQSKEAKLPSRSLPLLTMLAAVATTALLSMTLTLAVTRLRCPGEQRAGHQPLTAEEHPGSVQGASA